MATEPEQNTYRILTTVVLIIMVAAATAWTTRIVQKRAELAARLEAAIARTESLQLRIDATNARLDRLLTCRPEPSPPQASK